MGRLFRKVTKHLPNHALYHRLHKIWIHQSPTDVEDGAATPDAVLGFGVGDVHQDGALVELDDPRSVDQCRSRVPSTLTCFVCIQSAPDGHFTLLMILPPAGRPLHFLERCPEAPEGPVVKYAREPARTRRPYRDEMPLEACLASSLTGA